MCYTIASCGISSSSFISLLSLIISSLVTIFCSLSLLMIEETKQENLIYLFFFTRCHCLAIAIMVLIIAHVHTSVWYVHIALFHYNRYNYM